MEKKRSIAIIVVGLLELIKGALGSFFFIGLLIYVNHLKTTNQYWGLPAMWGDIVWLFSPGPLIFLSAIGIFVLKNYARKLNIFVNTICLLFSLCGTVVTVIQCFTDKDNYFLSGAAVFPIVSFILFIPPIIVLTRPKVKGQFK